MKRLQTKIHFDYNILYQYKKLEELRTWYINIVKLLLNKTILVIWTNHILFQINLVKYDIILPSKLKHFV